MGLTRTRRFSRGPQKAEVELNQLIHLIEGFSASLSLPVVHISTWLIWFSLYGSINTWAHSQSWLQWLFILNLLDLGTGAFICCAPPLGLSSACHLLTLNHICVNLQLLSNFMFNIMEQMLTMQGRSKLLIFACQCKSKDPSSIKLTW